MEGLRSFDSSGGQSIRADLRFWRPLLLHLEVIIGWCLEILGVQHILRASRRLFRGYEVSSTDDADGDTVPLDLQSPLVRGPILHTGDGL